MDDFHPLQVLKQVQPLAGLFEARQRLRDFLAKLDGNDQLDALLQSILASTERLQALKAETGGSKHGGRHPQTGHPQPEPEPQAAPAVEAPVAASATPAAGALSMLERIVQEGA